jgi:hypothetical protein
MIAVAANFRKGRRHHLYIYVAIKTSQDFCSKQHNHSLVRQAIFGEIDNGGRLVSWNQKNISGFEVASACTILVSPEINQMSMC